ncbi:MAG: flagellin [Alphaproteobacteria bacterium]
MSDISLTASMRSNLLSLQQTQSLMDVTQERLSTGKKVNSALDNPSSFYTAQSLTNRANDLSSLLDSMGQGVQTIKAADEAITSITALVQQAKAVANQARDVSVDKITSSGGFRHMNIAVSMEFEVKGATNKVTVNFNKTEAETFTIDQVAGKIVEELNKAAGADGKAIGGFGYEISADGQTFNIVSGNGAEAKVTQGGDGSLWGLTFSGTTGGAERAQYQERYNDILTQIDQLSKDAGYKGVNLLGGTDQSLTVVFNEDRSSSITIKGVDGSTAGLGLAQATSWGNLASIETSLDEVDAAITKLRSMSSEFGNNYSVVQTREEFTENLINVLEEGSDKLTLADMNEEFANMLALQTRQQLAINSLSLASQAAQSVLKLF